MSGDPQALKMPLVGLGTWRLTDETCVEAVYHAIRSGYRHIDTAQIYLNEESVGTAIERAIREGLVLREELFVTTKLWCTNFGVEQAGPSIDDSLRKLRLDYVDLVLLHWPFRLFGDDDGPRSLAHPVRHDAACVPGLWKRLETLVLDRKARHIGVSNFTARDIAPILDICTIPPFANQIELHPQLSGTQSVAFCRTHGIHVTAYSPLGSKQAPLARDPEIVAIAQSCALTPHKLLVSYPVAKGCSVVVCSHNPAHIADNLTTAPLSASTVAQLDNLEHKTHKRYIDPIDIWGIDTFEEASRRGAAP